MASSIIMILNRDEAIHANVHMQGVPIWMSPQIAADFSIENS